VSNPPASPPRWSLSDLYASVTDPALDADLDTSLRLASELAAEYRDRVASLDGPALAAMLGRYESTLAGLYRPQMYANLALSTDAADEPTRALSSKVGERANGAFNQLRFVDLELGRAPAAVHAAWLADPALDAFRHHLARARDAAPYALPGPVEEALSTKDLTGRRAWTQLYDELVAGWRFTVEGRGEPGSLTLADVRSLREDPDREVRRAATEAIQRQLAESAPTLGFIVNTLYQDHRLENGLRGHLDPVAPTMLDDELSRPVLDALMTAVEAHYPVAQRYFRWKAANLGLPVLESHDVLAPQPDGDREASWETARTEVLRAFEDLDPTVAELAGRFFTEGRIDAEPRQGKRDGAFCAGMIPGVAPRVLVNHHGRMRDVFTLAHELGHGVHFALAGQQQSLLNYWPTSPMAETASVFGELVLGRNLLAHESDPAARRAMLAARVEDALGTIHRQVSFTRYELRTHEARAEGVVPVETIASIWTGEMDRLYGDSVKRTERDRFGWAAIPHLIHYRFYCYSYAFGQLLVFALYDLWEREGAAFVPKYLRLLSGGGRDRPEALLAELGLDVRDPAFWSRGLAVVTRMVDDLTAGG
jgi:oligoendopeptidase F